MNFFEIVGSNIYEVMQERELNQTELADRLNISKQVMSKIINGQKAINALEIRTISEILGVAIERLIQEKEVKVENQSLVMLMGEITNRDTKDKIAFLNTVIDEMCNLEKLCHE